MWTEKFGHSFSLIEGPKIDDQMLGKHTKHYNT